MGGDDVRDVCDVCDVCSFENNANAFPSSVASEILVESIESSRGTS